MRQAIPFGLLGVLGFIGCKAETELPNAIESLPRREQLIRLSMDLRGIHPSEAELEFYEASQLPDDSYADYADQWIEETAFIPRVKEIFNERYLVRTGDVYFDTNEIPALAGIDDIVMA